MDGGIIPQVATITVGSETVQLSWCKWCQELFAFFIKSNRDAAAFAKDGRGGWRVFQAFGSEDDVKLAELAATQIDADTLE